MDCAAYGNTGLTLDTVTSWWRAYPDGIFGLFGENNLVGALGIWPVTAHFYYDFSSGSLREDQMCAAHIKLSHADSAQHWYLSGLNVQARRGRNLLVLLQDWLRRWVSTLPQNQRMCIGALAYTADGARLLKRFGFNLTTHAQKMRDRRDLYIATAADPQEFSDRILTRLPGVSRRRSLF